MCCASYVYLFYLRWTGFTSPQPIVGRVYPSTLAFYPSKGRVDGSLDEAVTRDDAGKPPQTTTRIWDDGYSCAGKKQLFCLSYGSFKVAKPCWWSTMLFANTDHSKSCIFTMFQWWFVVILRRLALYVVGKPPQVTTEMP